ncbi:MAG: hypothetical protein GY754_32545 [bacterium]|nr:hypothetical protein [bacterium]
MNKDVIKIFVSIIIFLTAGGVFAREREENRETEKPLIVTSIQLKGKTVKINTQDIENKSGQLSKEEVKRIVADITKRYRKRGYAAAYVDEVIIRNDGILVISIHETKVVAVRVRGAEKKTTINTDLEKVLLPEKGEVFNRFLLEKRIELAKKGFELESIKINLKETETGDMIINVLVEEKSPGEFYGQISMDMSYGITPMVGYFYLFRRSALDTNVLLSIRDDELSRVEANINYYIFRDELPKAVFFGLNFRRITDIWQSRETNYTTTSVTPVVGARHNTGIIYYGLFLSEIISFPKDYPGFDNAIYDTRLTFDIKISDKDLLLDPREASYLRLSLSAGWDNLNKIPYGIALLKAETSYFPLLWLRFTPKIQSRATTSVERFYWSYVYDETFLGFFDDYTASRFKNTAGLDIEIEAAKGLLYIGPLINCGYFLNEENNWIFKTGTGLKSSITISGITILLYYAWDITKNPKEGGFYFMAEGKF